MCTFFAFCFLKGFLASLNVFDDIPWLLFVFFIDFHEAFASSKRCWSLQVRHESIAISFVGKYRCS